MNDKFLVIEENLKLALIVEGGLDHATAAARNMIKSAPSLNPVIIDFYAAMNAPGALYQILQLAEKLMGDEPLDVDMRDTLGRGILNLTRNGLGIEPPPEEGEDDLLYFVHYSDTHGNEELGAFATLDDRVKHCTELISKSGLKKPIELLMTDFTEAWKEFKDRSADEGCYYTTEELPNPSTREFKKTANDFFDFVLSRTSQMRDDYTEEEIKVWNKFADMISAKKPWTENQTMA